MYTWHFVFFIISGQPEPNQTFKNDRPSHTMMMMMKNHFIDPCDHMMMIFIFHNLKICVDLGQHKTKPNKQTDKFLFSPHYCPVEQNIVHWTFFLGLLIHCCGVEEFFIFFFIFDSYNIYSSKEKKEKKNHTHKSNRMRTSSL